LPQGVEINLIAFLPGRIEVEDVAQLAAGELIIDGFLAGGRAEIVPVCFLTRWVPGFLVGLLTRRVVNLGIGDGARGIIIYLGKGAGGIDPILGFLTSAVERVVVGFHPGAAERFIVRFQTGRSEKFLVGF